MKIAVSNSGPLIHLATINQLELLFNLFEKILIPPSVYQETVEQGIKDGFLDARRIKREIELERIEIKPVPQNVESVENSKLHQGETDAITLALNSEEKIILLDDEEARLLARIYDLNVKGTIGVIIENVNLGFISAKEGKKLLRSVNQIMYLSSDVFDLTFKILDSKNNS
jgi:predicted nucleic acid-binding protein